MDKFEQFRNRKYIGQDYEFSKPWFVPARPQWKNLKSEFGSKAINVLEIGVFEGAATVWILENLFDNKESHFTAIDTFEGSIEHTDGRISPVTLSHLEERFQKNIEKTGKSAQVNIMKGFSYEQLLKLNSDNSGTKFDLIYIDGSHKAEDVLADAVLSWRLLKPNGIMILDDLEWDHFKEDYNNPKIAIQSFVACHKFEIEVIAQNYQLAIRKVVNKERAYSVLQERPPFEIVYKDCE